MDFFTLPSVDSISSLTNALFVVCIFDLFVVLAFALYRSRYISNIVCYMFLWNPVQIAKSVLDKAYPYTTFVDVLTKMLDTAAERKKPPYLRQTEEKFRDLVDEVMAEVENSASNGHLRRRFHNQLKRICEEALVVEA
nr:hypothetical protein Iba_chr09dCG10150 [Ipomoea batatas]